MQGRHHLSWSRRVGSRLVSRIKQGEVRQLARAEIDRKWLSVVVSNAAGCSAGRQAFRLAWTPSFRPARERQPQRQRDPHVHPPRRAVALSPRRGGKSPDPPEAPVRLRTSGRVFLGVSMWCRVSDSNQRPAVYKRFGPGRPVSLHSRISSAMWGATRRLARGRGFTRAAP
jgi:hypothetical protein